MYDDASRVGVGGRSRKERGVATTSAISGQFIHRARFTFQVIELA